LAIIFGANHQVLHLLTGSKYERDLWLKGLRFAQHIDQYMDQKEQTDKYPLLYQDQNAWLNSSQTFTEEEVKNILLFTHAM
jgi:hypothetical protein